MTDLSINELKYQGKKAKAIYVYKATMNDELTFITDDIIVITQSSEDETWLEGTLNGRTGWFPSNYVEFLSNETSNLGNQSQNQGESTDSLRQYDDPDDQYDYSFRIKVINEFKRTEEDFLDEMCKFIKTALIPLQANKSIEIFPGLFLNQLNSSIDELLRCHQAFFQQLKEIAENSDAKIGYLLINMAARFKLVYETYAKNNPKFTNVINKKKEVLAKFFESSLSKMINTASINANALSSTAVVTIYLTKYLAAPFKQLESYSKLLKELYRFTEDHHVDRGDVQRSMEFYSELSTSVQEIRHKKECELDIMSSRINNVDEDIFKNGESLFLSSVIILTKTGERKDRILLLFQNFLILLAQTNGKQNEFDFDTQIPFFNQNPSSVGGPIQLIQIKKCSGIDLINQHGLNIDPSAIKYFIELTCVNGEHMLIVCSTSYDLKMIMELISNQLSKIQFSLNNRSLRSTPPAVSASTTTNSPSFKAASFNSPKSPHNTSFKALTGNLSGSTLLNNSNSTNHNAMLRIKQFSMRPHPPLIPHFQLPTDLNVSGTGTPSGSNTQANNNVSNNSSASDLNQTLKRFMYKKAKLSEPFGKYHGADDDLKLLNVIETFCKTKVRQSVNINLQENGVTSPLNKSLQSQKILDSEQNGRADDLNEIKKSNKELKMLVSGLQKQLEQEKLSRRKLEMFIRKEMKHQLSNSPATNIDLAKIMSSIDHESTI